ncbi:MAG: hypothetical protein U5L96_15650 [Owenweeksia sp.]|nr:hypothetical protein [Owenweeksia sp.]
MTIEEKINFEQISKMVDITEEELSFLNPSFRHKLIPKNTTDPYHLVLPSDKIGQFYCQ